jgi:hypothetical protein
MNGVNTTLYSPIDSVDGFRLLVLKPGPNSSEIECNLVAANSIEGLQYQALSYEWGSPDDPKHIKLNGVSVSVRQNLWWALWHLRKARATERIIWIDALSINQMDDKERGHQVALMGRIFRNADVICWLGRPKAAWVESCERAMQYLESIIERHEKSRVGDNSMAVAIQGDGYKRLGKNKLTSMGYRDAMKVAVESGEYSYLKSGLAVRRGFRKVLWARYQAWRMGLKRRMMGVLGKKFS